MPLAGFLLGGGLGQNWGRWKPACFSVDAVEVVTAEGEVVRADEEHGRDLLWLARGSGPGFPGIVTRFHLALHPLPAAATSSVRAFPIAEAPTALEWVPQVEEQLPVEVEMCTFLGGSSLPGIGDMLGLTEPTVTRANINTVMLPDPGSGFPRPGAYSMDRRTVTVVYSMWDDPAEDDANRAWVAETMRTIEQHATSRYLGEGDPRVAPGRIAACFDEESWARIALLRRRYDPDGLFQDYLDETY